MPNITYIDNIPNTPNNPSNDAPNMKINTNAIDTLIDVDHYSFNQNNGGWHTQSTYPTLLSAPVTTAAQGAVYTKTDTNSTSQLFYTQDNSTDQYQLTRCIHANIATFATSTVYNGAIPNLTGGWTFLPGGMLLQYGRLQSPNPATPNITITFPVAFTTTPVFITLGQVRNNTDDKTVSITQGSISTTGFTIILSSTDLPTAVHWHAIGV